VGCAARVPGPVDGKSNLFLLLLIIACASLQGGQFRSINEKLYTQPGSASFEMMQKEPELFDAVSCCLPSAGLPETCGCA
jgi:hypothetical protein